MGPSEELKCKNCMFWSGKNGYIGYCTKYNKFIWGEGNCNSISRFSLSSQPEVVKNEPSVVLVDSREGRSDVPQLLENLGVPYRVVELEVGDYVIGDVAIERKEVSDFVSSIIDGRLHNQLYNLSKAYRKSYLVVIGYISEALLYSKVPRNAVISALVGASVKVSPDGEQGDVNVVMLESDWDFAYFIYYLWQKLNNPEPRLPRHVKIGLEGDDELLYIVSSISGVGPKKAHKLLEHFKTVQNLANATEEELRSVNGIGKKLAKKVYTTLRRKYNGELKLFRGEVE